MGVGRLNWGWQAGGFRPRGATETPARSGIVINDSIVLIVAIADREAEGKPALQAIEDGCCDRLWAVILTSLTIVAGLATATLLILPAMLAVGHDLRRLTMN